MYCRLKARMVCFPQNAVALDKTGRCHLVQFRFDADK